MLPILGILIEMKSSLKLLNKANNYETPKLQSNLKCPSCFKTLQKDFIIVQKKSLAQLNVQDSTLSGFLY